MRSISILLHCCTELKGKRSFQYLRGVSNFVLPKSESFQFQKWSLNFEKVLGSSSTEKSIIGWTKHFRLNICGLLDDTITLNKSRIEFYIRDGILDYHSLQTKNIIIHRLPTTANDVFSWEKIPIWKELSGK